MVVATPGPVFGYLIDSLQERGRPLLLLGTALLVIVVGGAAAALIAGRRRRGRVTTSLAVAGGLWLLSLPLVGAAQGTLASGATWSALLSWLVVTVPPQLALERFPRRRALPSPGRDLEGAQVSRRRFLELTGAVLGAATLGYLGTKVLSAGSPEIPSPAGPEVGRLPSEVTPAADFYVVSKDLFGPPRVNPGSWRLRVRGSRSLALSRDDIRAFHAVEQVQTLECISNPVAGDLISNGRWRGVPLGAILHRAGVPPGTGQVVFRCADGYTESLTLAQCLQPTTLLATQLDGADLAPAHGFPARILIPGLYGMKNPKWLTGISFQGHQYQGYWEKQGWDPAAAPTIYSRFDFPTGGAHLASGRRYRLSGVAYAGDRGVRWVEVSFDAGRGWVRARLQPALTQFAWRVWSLPWSPAPGLYSLELRAADGQGRVQSGRATGSFPAGASGRQQLRVVVS